MKIKSNLAYPTQVAMCQPSNSAAWIVFLLCCSMIKKEKARRWSSPEPSISGLMTPGRRQAIRSFFVERAGVRKGDSVCESFCWWYLVLRVLLRGMLLEDWYSIMLIPHSRRARWQ